MFCFCNAHSERGPRDRPELTSVDLEVDDLLDFPAEGELLAVVPLRAGLLQVFREDVVLIAQAALVGGAVAVVAGDRITLKKILRMKMVRVAAEVSKSV